MHVIDEGQEPVEINIDASKVFFIIVKAREFDAKVDPVEPIRPPTQPTTVSARSSKTMRMMRPSKNCAARSPFSTTTKSSI